MIVKMFLMYLLFAIQTPVEQTQTGTISLNFSGISPKKGHLQISVFNGGIGFPNCKQSVIKSFALKVQPGKNSLTIPNLPYGEYAISCYLDVNSNKKLDTNFFGIPSEKTGASNNPPSGSVPSYEDAKFILNKNKLTLSIQFN